MPAASDLMVVVAGCDMAGARQRFVHGAALLEASYLRDTQFQSPALLLSDYRLAPSFHTAQILSDPWGLLTPLQADVSQEFAKKEWVIRRCAHARDKVLANLRSIDKPAPLHDQVVACLFAAGVTTHILLTAGLRNPTVRARYETVREILAAHGREQFHEALLALLGSAQMSPEDVSRYAAALPEMPGEIAPGCHREAMFRIAVAHSRRRELSAGYRELLSGMGLSTKRSDPRARLGNRARAPRGKFRGRGNRGGERIPLRA